MILVSCAPAAKVVSTETAMSPSTITPTLPSPTITPTLTVVPTPIGGGTLKVAFYASISNINYLIVGDYFSGKINHRIRVRNISGQDNKISWSPDGAYLLFIDMAEHSTDDMKVNLLDTKTGKVTYLVCTQRLSDNER